MEFQFNGRYEIILKVKTNWARDLLRAAFIFGKVPETRRGLSEPLYGLETSCREWYGALKWPPAGKLGGKVELPLLDMSVLSRAWGWGFELWLCGVLPGEKYRV